jgi:1-acyl-sn-glycerol-3-phosphate acyltransferase
MCPWITVEPRGLNFSSAMGESGKPVLILGNHTSFLDTLLFAAFIDMRVVGGIKTLVAASLFKLPLLGYIMKSIGHIPVYFNKAKEHIAGQFETDRSKSDQTMAS